MTVEVCIDAPAQSLLLTEVWERPRYVCNDPTGLAALAPVVTIPKRILLLCSGGRWRWSLGVQAALVAAQVTSRISRSK